MPWSAVKRFSRALISAGNWRSSSNTQQHALEDVLASAQSRVPRSAGPVTSRALPKTSTVDPGKSRDRGTSGHQMRFMIVLVRSLFKKIGRAHV